VRRLEFVDGAGGSSPAAATPMQQTPRAETRTEPPRPETPAQEPDGDSRPEVQRRPPPPPDYIRGASAVHGDDAMDTGGARVDEILLSTPEGNFHVSNTAEAGQSQPPPVSPPSRPVSPVVEGRVFGEVDRPVPPSPDETDREAAITRFVLEALYEVWSPDPESAPATTAKTALAILIRHGLLSETVETGSLDNFKGVVEELLSSASRRRKVAEAFTEFSMMEVSSGGG
jgi:hypothetical protein